MSPKNHIQRSRDLVQLLLFYNLFISHDGVAVINTEEVQIARSGWQDRVNFKNDNAVEGHIMIIIT